MRRIIYASFARQAFSVRELFDLLAHARTDNLRRDITGALFYQDRFFLQCIEGPSVEIAALFDRIALDPRHAGFTVLSDQTLVAKRLFSSWAMGFFHMDAVEALAPEGLLANGEDFAAAIAADEMTDPAALILRQYWAANTRKLGLPRGKNARKALPLD